TLGTDGTLWVGTERGLARLNKDGQWQSYTKASTKDGLPDDHVPALALDTDGALWVGTGGGLARFDKDGQWRNYTKASTKDGLPHNGIVTLSRGGMLLRSVARCGEVPWTPIGLTPSQPRGAGELTSTPLS